MTEQIKRFIPRNGGAMYAHEDGHYVGYDDHAAIVAKLQQQVADLTAKQSSNIVPGKMRCAKCKFTLIRKTLFLKSGTVGAGDNVTEPCPNGCGPLWPVTWEQDAREGYDACDALFERAKVAEEALATLPSQQQGAQPDHIADANEMVEQPASPSSAPATADDQQALADSNHWQEFLTARANVIDWMWDERSCADIASSLSMDQQQVALIRMRDRSLDLAAPAALTPESKPVQEGSETA